MKTKILDVLFVVLVEIMFILFVAIIMISVFETEESKVDGLEEITGAMQSYDVYHESLNLQYKNIKTTERYDDKYFGYLEDIQEARDKTFMRGKIFLREK
jgi:hypothetical protein